MPLPKLNIPVYETILPSTEKVIKYRPFLVKEEKLLLTAQEGGDDAEALLPAVKQIISNCVQSKIDVEKLPSFDIEYLFLRLRAKSVGETSTIALKPYPCSENNGELCNNVTEVEINLEEVKVEKNKEHTSKIMLDDSVGIKMSYPDLETIKSDMGVSAGMEIIKKCIEMIFTEKETHEKGSFSEKELDDFLDSLNTEQFLKIQSFYETMPQLKHTVKYKCTTCGEDKETTIQGLNSFFA